MTNKEENASMANEVTLDHAVAKLDLATPFWRIDSGRDGHHLVMLNAQHGMEVQGTEVALRFRDACAECLTSGKVTLVPFANLPAIRHRRVTSDVGPGQGKPDTKNRNMQQTWPGDPEGNDIQRIAYALDAKVMSDCDRLVDMHCWGQHQAAAVLAASDNEHSVSMAKATGLRFVRWGQVPDLTKPIKSSSHMVYSRGGAAIVIELSGQNQVQESEVLLGLRAMTNIARMLGMMEGQPDLPDGAMIEPTPDRLESIEAPHGGLFVGADVKPGDRVEHGQELGHLIRDDTMEVVSFTAPTSGYLWHHGRVGDSWHPYASEGELLIAIARDPL